MQPKRLGKCHVIAAYYVNGTFIDMQREEIIACKFIVSYA